MIVFLGVASTLMALALFASALTRIAGVRPIDRMSAGHWGLFTRTSEPRRSLSAEERRWQTLLLKAADDEGTWRDVSSRLDQLEKDLGGAPSGGTSPNFDRSELHATIARLEGLIEGESNLHD